MKRKKKAVAKKVTKKVTKKAAPKAKATKKATKKVSPIPAGYHTATPYLTCLGAAEAIAFYTKAFGAKEVVRMPGPDGKVMHAEIKIGDSMVMLGEEDRSRGGTAPPTLGGSAVGIMLYVKDVDAAYARATAAGATAQMPPMDMFWGDRMGTLVDPFGHKWSMGTHTEDVSGKEMGRRMAAEFAKQVPGGQ